MLPPFCCRFSVEAFLVFCAFTSVFRFCVVFVCFYCDTYGCPAQLVHTNNVFGGFTLSNHLNNIPWSQGSSLLPLRFLPLFLSPILYGLSIPTARRFPPKGADSRPRALLVSAFAHSQLSAGFRIPSVCLFYIEICQPALSCCNVAVGFCVPSVFRV